MLNAIEKLNLQIEEKSSLNPVKGVFSTHIQEKNCPLVFTNGKGSTLLASRVSALGELFERLSCNYFFNDYYFGEDIVNSKFINHPNEKWFSIDDSNTYESLLNSKLWSIYNSNNELSLDDLYDINSGYTTKGICALPFTRVSDKKITYFPVNILNNLYVSNGMAAGNSKEEAQIQALCEIYERYVKNKIISQEITPPTVPEDILNNYPKIKESIDEIEKNGFRVRVCDASLGGLYPVVSVALIEPTSGVVLLSFGSHPEFEVALERSVTELLQGRGLNNISDLLPPSLNKEEIADSNNLVEHFINSTGVVSYKFFSNKADYKFSNWSNHSSIENQLNYLIDIAHFQDLDIYIAEYKELGIYCCRVLIPSLSEIYPIDDLIWNNSAEGVYLQMPILNLDTLSNEQIEELIQSLEQEQYLDSTKVSELIGILADENSKWDTLQIGELKAMLYLAIGNLEKAKYYINWTLYYATLDDKTLGIYRVIDTILEIKLSNIDSTEIISTLKNIFSSDIIDIAEKILKGKIKFYNLNSPTLKLNGLKKHNEMLKIYKKVLATI